MSMQNLNNKNGIAVLRILFFAMMFGQIAFICIIGWLRTRPDYSQNFTDNKMLLGAIALVSALAVLLAFKLYASKIKLAQEAGATQEKVTIYKTGNIIRWAILEAMVLLNLIMFFVMGDFNFMLFGLAAFLIFLSTMPTGQRAMRELGLGDIENP